MFGELYAKALELFGRGFLLSSFVPCLIVVSGVWLSADRAGFLKAISEWAAKEMNAKASSALLLLLGVYLLAYVLYGVRDAVTDLLRTGRLWLFSPVRAWRRRRFLQARLDRQERFDGSLGVPQAAVWARAGFGDPSPEYVVLQKGLTIEQLAERAGERLDRLERWMRRGRLGKTLGVRQGETLARLLWKLQQLAVRKQELASPLVRRLQDLAKDGAGGSFLPEWCGAIQRRSFADVVDAYQPVFAEPPEKDIQPTALGNVLAWGAAYPTKRYGIQAPFLHPRLAKVIDKEYQEKLDDAKTFFDFAVLTTVLAGVAAVLLAAWFLRPVWSLWPVGRPWALPPWDAIRTAIVLAWLAASHAFYRIAVTSARTYAVALNSTVDLHRLKLLEALGVAPPATVEEESAIWRQLEASFLDGTMPSVKLKTGA